MKILFTGTIHVGKTTLLEHLRAEKLPFVGFISEVAREILTKDPVLEMDSSLQDMLFEEQVKREEEAKKNLPNSHL